MTEQFPQERFYAACVEREQAVLGAMMMVQNAWAIISGRIDEDDFSDPINARIFAAASGILASGKPASPMALRPFLAAIDGDFDVMGYVARLCAHAPVPALAAHAVELLSDMSARRKMAILAEGFAQRAIEPQINEPSAEIAAEFVGKIQALANKSNPEDTRREAGASAATIIARAKRIRAGEDKDESFSTGFSDLDRLTGGYRPGEFWFVGGRPGAGKTIFATSSGQKVARRGIGVLLFSMEVEENQTIARVLSDMSYISRRPIPFGLIRRGQLDEEEIWRLEDAQKRLAQIPFVFDVASRLSVAEIGLRVRAEKAKMAKKGRRLGVVFIDYLNFIKASDRYKGSRVNEIGEITISLKQLSKDEGVCIVLLGQLNRQIEARDRGDKRPGMADIRDSGNIEQDTDVIAFIHRESYFIEKSAEYRNGDAEALNEFADKQHKAELILGKNRAGATNTVNLWCDVACSSMADGERP